MESNWDGALPENWAEATIGDLIGTHGVFKDGDWVESKGQDQNGLARLIQLADIGDSEFRNKSSRFLTTEKAIELNCTFLKAGDILVARMPDPLGRACLFPLHGSKKFVTVVDVCVIRFDNDCMDAKYFMYALNSPTSRKSISGYQTGSTRKRISRGNLSTVQFPIAPLPEQHRIVAKIEELFSELDKGIENLKTARAQLKVYRQALLKYAFEGKLTAQWRAERSVTPCHPREAEKKSVIPAQAGIQPLNDVDSRLRGNDEMGGGNDEVGGGNDEPLETAAALLKRIQQERAQRYQQQLADWEKSPSIPLLQRGKTTSAAASVPHFEKGGLGGICRGTSKPKAPKPLPPLTAEELAELPELPEGWGYIQIGNLLDVVSGNTPKGIEITKGTEIPYYRVSDMNRDGNEVSMNTSATYLSENEAAEIGLTIYPVGTIIFPKRGGAIATNKKRRLARRSCFDLNLMGLTNLPDSLSAGYLWLWMLALDLASISDGSNVPQINNRNVEPLAFPICSFEEQALIVELAEARLSEADQLELTITTSLQQAEALRQSILKKAFSGQLVPQDPHDEPASALLARIKAERATAEENSAVRQRGKRG